MSERRSTARLSALVILAAAAVYLVGNASVCLWDRDEPRYAQTSRQMLASGDWVVPRLLDQVRTAKPVFMYWCQATAMALIGDTVFAARLPSVVGMTLTLVLLGITLRRAIGGRRSLWTVFVLATSALSIAAAKMCVTDAVLLFFVTTTQLCVFYGWNRGMSWLGAVVMGVAMGLAGLTKGPVVLGVALMTLAAQAVLRMIDIAWSIRISEPRRAETRRLGGVLDYADADLGRHGLSRRTGRWAGCVLRYGLEKLRSFRAPGLTLVMLAIVLALSINAPWLYLVHQREPNFLPTIIGHDVIERMKTGLEGHKGPPGFYLITIWFTFFPWSLLLPACMISAWKHRHLPPIRFALAWVIGPWVMFEIVQTKLVHYVLPVFPALAFLMADMLIRAARKRWFADRGFLRIVLVWGTIVILISLSPWLATLIFGAASLAALAAMIVLPLLAFEYARQVWLYFRANRALDAAAVMGIGMMLCMVVLFGLYLPNASYLRVSLQLAQVLKAAGATEPGDVVMIDYKETSLAFYQGGTIRPQPHMYLMATAPPEWPRWVVISDAIWRRMPVEVRAQLEVVATAHGLNYAGKDADRRHIIDVHVLRNRSRSGERQ
jgi:4-amino-4-deoxy-L-arabinose transferase-like glycosyltransferase